MLISIGALACEFILVPFRPWWTSWNFRETSKFSLVEPISSFGANTFSILIIRSWWASYAVSSDDEISISANTLTIFIYFISSADWNTLSIAQSFSVLARRNTLTSCIVLSWSTGNTNAIAHITIQSFTGILISNTSRRTFSSNTGQSISKDVNSLRSSSKAVTKIFDSCQVIVSNSIR